MPEKIRSKPKKALRVCPAHRAWVRMHRCCVLGCAKLPIECAHVRHGTDGGVGLKPSDRWAISLCTWHYGEQHRIGESRFAQRYDLDLIALACEFARRSPHRERLAWQ
ncbi:putative HNHc nuclease [Sphingomonas limnosediminicola]|uniref:putative HNHc nuclease n=1 Tax=Sphingomonas limnosediminicola TaxID=940133 RepID=UPI0031D43561